MATRLLLLVSLLGILTSLPAQRNWQGFVEGVYPIHLQLSATSPNARVQFTADTEPISLLGACHAGTCKYTAVDTALVFEFTQTADALTGQLRSGDALIRNFIATPTSDVQLNSNACGTDLRLKRWVNAEGETILVQTNLPGGKVKGYVYLEGQCTSLAFSTSSTADKVHLTGIHGSEVVGSFTLSQADTTATLHLELGGSTQKIQLLVAEVIPLTCLQAKGKLDFVLPTVNADEWVVVNLANKMDNDQLLYAQQDWWSTLADHAGTDFAHGWFEPTRFDDEVLSGWMYMQRGDQLNVLPLVCFRILVDKEQRGAPTTEKTGLKFYRTVKLLAHRKQQQHLQDRAQLAVTDTYADFSDEAFSAWIDNQGFSYHVIHPEGIATGSQGHALYGQVQGLTRWKDLWKEDQFPAWLTNTTSAE